MFCIVYTLIGFVVAFITIRVMSKEYCGRGEYDEKIYRYIVDMTHLAIGFATLFVWPISLLVLIIAWFDDNQDRTVFTVERGAFDNWLNCQAARLAKFRKIVLDKSK